MSRAPVPDQEVEVLKALLVGLCALVVVAHAAAAATKHAAAHTTKAARAARSLDERLEERLRIARKERSVIRFFESHRRLLSSRQHRVVARQILRKARVDLARTSMQIASLRRAVGAREIRRIETAPPRVAICDVFGPYCRQAISVAWCESRLQTTAQNGQYLGLFQMGSNERRLFGHGPSAHDQAIAAHKYFVVSGQDWSPWSCKPFGIPVAE